MANKIDTPGYLLKRLRQSGFIAIRLFNKFSDSDPRRWTIMIDPAGASIFVTCYENYPDVGDISFEFNDGGQNWPKNFFLKTKSVEVILYQLIEKGIASYNGVTAERDSDAMISYIKSRVSAVNHLSEESGTGQ